MVGLVPVQPSGALLARPLYNYLLFDTEWVEPGKETVFFERPREFAADDSVTGFGLRRKFFGTHTNMYQGNCLPAGYYGKVGRVLPLPDVLCLRVDGHGLDFKIPAPQLWLAGQPSQKTEFDLPSQEHFKLVLPPVPGLPYPVELQAHILFKALFCPLAG